ncbi:hypothetical protein [Glycomyces harbinensis]|uniref:hypothetical protein n=1 Tax=Glycomyces harbinensis TaxID=58114 RepID=UPI000B830B6D|nr:hypothetical protein [Glycomyces harbinensis]
MARETGDASEEKTLNTDVPKWLVRTAALAAGLTLLAGCAIDKGSALAADFEEHWADTADVAEIDTYGANTLPFMGSATGTLILEDGTSADRVAELANELGAYVADNCEVTGEITAEGVTFAVAPDSGRTGQVVEMWESLTADDRVSSGAIDIGFQNEDSWTIEITAADGSGAMAVFNEMAADTDPYRPFSSATVTTLEVSTVQGAPTSLRVATDNEGRVPAAAIAAYEAVAAQYTVVGGALLSEHGTERASIVVATGADAAHADELARSAAPGLTDLEVTVESGN